MIPLCSRLLMGAEAIISSQGKKGMGRECVRTPRDIADPRKEIQHNMTYIHCMHMLPFLPRELQSHARFVSSNHFFVLLSLSFSFSFFISLRFSRFLSLPPLSLVSCFLLSLFHLLFLRFFFPSLTRIQFLIFPFFVSLFYE